MPPTFTAISLDRLIDDRGVSNSQLEKKRSTPPPPPTTTTTKTTTDKKQIHRVSPLLYATPEATPLPDSPSSFPPSPYIINHKRRGPRLLLKTLSHEDISLQQPTTTTTTTTTTTEVERRRVDVNLIHKEDISVTQPAKEDEGIIQENGSKEEMVVVDSIGEFSFTSPVSEVGTNGFHDHSIASSSNLENGLGKAENLSQLVAIKSDREYDCEDFFDPQDTISATSNTEVEDNSGGVDRSLRMSTPIGEYFDAYEELSSEGGRSSSFRDVEPELREMRLNLLMEIEKQRQAEEVLNNMQTQWQRLQQQLSLVGLTLPAASTITAEDENWSCDSAEDLLKQIHIARVVSESVGRGFAKAEVEKEMESRIESKNFEITRLWDRLHYYETVNREMSQRNQESIEMARSQRERRKRRQRWVWSSIGAAITLGTVALAWSYLPTASESSSAYSSDAPEVNDSAKP